MRDILKALNLPPKSIDKDALAKALTNCLFREIIEDAHTTYNIKQCDMEAMTRQSVNRAKVIVDLLNDEQMLLAFQGLYSLGANEAWENPVQTEETNKMRDTLKSIANGEY